MRKCGNQWKQNVEKSSNFVKENGDQLRQLSNLNSSIDKCE